MNKNTLILKLNEFLIDLRYSEKTYNTIRKYKCNVLNFIEYLPHDREITKDDVLNFKTFLLSDGRYKTSTINSYIVSINKFLKYCDLKELTVKQIKQQQKSSLESILSVSDYKRMLRHAKQKNRIDMYYIMKILAMTGIRISELHFFTAENLKSNTILIHNKGKERNIVIRQDLHRELKKYIKSEGIKEGYIFPSKIAKGKMINESTIWRQMKNIAGIARVNKSKVHPHSFRHLFAKLFLDEYTGNITELADILGHNNLETTRIYTRTTNEEKRKHIEKINFGGNR